jgi:hypothetical protein
VRASRAIRSPSPSATASRASAAPVARSGLQAASTADQAHIDGRFRDHSRISEEPDGKEHVFRLIAVSVGAFADPAFPPATGSGYDHRRHPWVGLPDSVQRISQDFDL